MNLVANTIGIKDNTTNIKDSFITNSLRDLKQGNTFTGEIIAIDGQEVQIKLSDKTVITAKIDQQLQVSLGQTIKFQVKNNSDSLLELKPITDSSNQNKNVLKALLAANLPINDRTMELVNSLMEEGLPIDKHTIQQLYKLVLSHKDSNPSSIVQMNRLQLPITPENILQFESYKEYRYQLVKGFETITNEIPKVFNELVTDGKPSKALEFYSKIINMIGKDANLTEVQNSSIDDKILLGKQYNQSQVSISNIIKQNNSPIANTTNGNNQVINPLITNTASDNNQAINPRTTSTQVMNSLITNMTSDNNQVINPLHSGIDLNIIDGKVINEINSQELISNGISRPVINSNISGELKIQDELEISLNDKATNLLNMKSADEELGKLDSSQFLKLQSATKNAVEIGTILQPGERENLTKLLEPLQLPTIIIEEMKDGILSTKEVLNIVKNLMTTASQGNGATILNDIFASSEFSEIMKEQLMREWTLEPTQVNQNKNIEDLYNRMKDQTMKMIEVLSNVGKETTTMMKSVTNMQNNLDFMNQLNQLLSYVQLPIKMGKENAHGELYVYTNKKNLAKKDGKVSALLHLDMESLGNIDIYVALDNGKINSKFYLEKEELIDFMKKNIPLLVERLEKRGYQMESEVLKREKNETMIEHIMEEERPNQLLSKTAFDVRA